MISQWVRGEDNMLVTETKDIRAAELDEELLILDVSDEALERAAPIR